MTLGRRLGCANLRHSRTRRLHDRLDDTKMIAGRARWIRLVDLRVAGS